MRMPRPALIVCLGAALTLFGAQAFAYEKEIQTVSRTIAEQLTETHRLTVAILDFTDLQGRASPLGKFLAQEMSTILSNPDENFRVVDRKMILDLIAKNKLSGILEQDNAARLGQVAKAQTQTLVMGTITPLVDSVRLSVRVLDCATAKIISSASADIPRTQSIENLLNGQGMVRPRQVGPPILTKELALPPPASVLSETKDKESEAPPSTVKQYSTLDTAPEEERTAVPPEVFSKKCGPVHISIKKVVADKNEIAVTLECFNTAPYEIGILLDSEKQPKLIDANKNEWQYLKGDIASRPAENIGLYKHVASTLDSNTATDFNLIFWNGNRIYPLCFAYSFASKVFIYNKDNIYNYNLFFERLGILFNLRVQ